MAARAPVPAPAVAVVPARLPAPAAASFPAAPPRPRPAGSPVRRARVLLRRAGALRPPPLFAPSVDSMWGDPSPAPLWGEPVTVASPARGSRMRRSGPR